MTHPRIRRRVSRRFTTGKTGGPQWQNSVLGGTGPDGRQSHRDVQERRGVVQECRGRTGHRNVRNLTAQECHAGRHGEDRSSGVVFPGATPPDRTGVSGLASGRVMEATGPPSPRLPGILSSARPTELLAIPSLANPELVGPTGLPGNSSLAGPLEALSCQESPGNPELPGKQGIRVCPGSRDVGTIRGDEYSSPSGRHVRPASRSPSGVVHAPGRAFPARVPRSS